MSSLSRGRGVFGASVQFKVNGEETTEYDPRTFYSGRLESKCKGQNSDSSTGRWVHEKD